MCPPPNMSDCADKAGVYIYTVLARQVCMCSYIWWQVNVYIVYICIVYMYKYIYTSIYVLCWRGECVYI
jgi:hypothetical protein